MTWKSSFLSKLIYYDCIIKCVVSENSTTLRIFLGKFHFVHVLSSGFRLLKHVFGLCLRSL